MKIITLTLLFATGASADSYEWDRLKDRVEQLEQDANLARFEQKLTQDNAHLEAMLAEQRESFEKVFAPYLNN